MAGSNELRQELLAGLEKVPALSDPAGAESREVREAPLAGLEEEVRARLVVVPVPVGILALRRRLRPEVKAVAHGPLDRLAVVLQGQAPGDARALPDGAAVGDGLDQDLVLREGQVLESVLVVVAVRGGGGLRGDAPAATRDDVGGGAQEVRGLHVVHLLGVAVPGDDDVDAVVEGELLPMALAPLRREVRHHDLPPRLGHPECSVKPLDLGAPQPREPGRAVVHRIWSVHSASRIFRVHLPGADVVVLVRVGVGGVEHVRVHEVVVHIEAIVPHQLRPVQRRREPSPRAGSTCCPRVGDGLVPAGGEGEAAEVMVPEHPEPLLVLQANSTVDALEDALPLTAAIVALGDRLAALVVHATPVKVVTDIDDVVGAAPLGSPHHLLGNGELGNVVGTEDECPMVVLELPRPVVGRHRDLALAGGDSAPIADDEDVVGPALDGREADWW
mmetsp:Transcript_82198/g.183619  ORF Transcript_82198/g.183619 Transcript_82198/m.183619 type:complete len:446 (-) Transcript_82198:187-1524(-)